VGSSRVFVPAADPLFCSAKNWTFPIYTSETASLKGSIMR
jgi:hypothetical protein